VIVDIIIVRGVRHLGSRHHRHSPLIRQQEWKFRVRQDHICDL
jgi:hypothetical protein